MSRRTDPTDRPDAALIQALGLELRIEPLPAARRAALRGRVLAAATLTLQPPSAESTTLMSVVRAGEGNWLPLLPGLSIKFLRVDVAARSQSSLWRLDPGAQIPAHPHSAEEECIVLEGSVRFGGRDYGRGDFLLARAGLQHDRFDCADGALLYIRSELTAPLAALARRDGFVA
ncbi:MAG: cupin domain-containing protein [Tahibacter sp.]